MTGRTAERCHTVVTLLLLLMSAPIANSSAEASADNKRISVRPDPLDWPYWRGQEFNGISRETGLIDGFDPAGGPGSNVLWKREDLGGRSTPVVLNGRLYLMARAEPGTPREGEKVVCLDARTGKTLWENRFNVWLSDVPDVRVGWSSVVADPETGLVYALGVCGYFQCIDGATGKTVWSNALHETFGMLSTYGGRTGFPVVSEDLVIVSGVTTGWGEMAQPSHRFLAFDKRSGQIVWTQNTRPLPYDVTYSAPTVTLLGGEKALIVGTGDGQLWAFHVRTGTPLWHCELSKRGLNVSPLVVGDTVFMGHSEENIDTTAMGCVFALNGKSRGEVTKSSVFWRQDELPVGKSSPLLVDDRLYCIDDGAKLHILDAKTGQPVTRRKTLGTAAAASPLYADGKIYAFTVSGRWSILRPDSQRGVTTVREGRLPAGEECQASPICSHGCIYLETTAALYCLHDATKQPGSTPRPAEAQEPAVSEDPQPKHLQIVPAELLTRPGARHAFKVRLFNSRGQFLRESAASFALDGPGQIAADGAFTAAPQAAHSATFVSARVGDLVGRARVRVVPDLPWHFDFEGSREPPITWVGARYRHVVRNIEGNNVLVKVTTIPKGTRSQAWFGPHELHDYTIQADVMGAVNNQQMPDIGLIAQGYTLDLQGGHQKLQIRTWPAQLRVTTTVDFAWKPNQWYTMKFRAANENGKAVLRGKVWPKGETEPSAWTAEAVDESPNVTGSPGLFGNATSAEIFLDNLRVFPN